MDIYLCKKNLYNFIFKTNYAYDVCGNYIGLDPAAQERWCCLRSMPQDQQHQHIILMMIHHHVPSRHIHTEHTYTPHIDSWYRPCGRFTQTIPPSKSLIWFSSFQGALYSSGTVEMGWWWADDSWNSPGRTQSRVLLGLPFMCHCFSMFRCGCTEELLSHNIQVLVLTLSNYVSSSWWASGNTWMRCVEG